MRKLKSPFFKVDKKNLYYLDNKIISELDGIQKVIDYILRNEGVYYEECSIKKYDETVLVLEPHPDDFALSALAYTYNNYNAVVFNIFSKTSLEYFTWKDYISITQAEYEQLRLEESKFAIEKVLKESFISMKEASTRITKKTDETLKKEICDNLDNILNKNKKITTVMIPMGIGEHPDHLIVYDSIINNLDKYCKYKLIFYPEYPYARCKKKYMERLSELKRKYSLNEVIIDIEDKIEKIVDCISIYKSQFDDINRNQMLALVREDARALQSEYDVDNMIMVYFEMVVKK